VVETNQSRGVRLLPTSSRWIREWLLQSSGWQVHDESGLVPIKPRHICLLFKRFQSYYGDTTRAYVQTLEARRIPHILVGGRSFHDREEVVALRVALEAIEWPDDELSVYAFLRGPLLAVSDEELLCFRRDFVRLNPLRRFDEQERAKHSAVVDGLELLRGLNLERNRRPVADTVERLLSETRAHASLAMWPSGEQALANALAIVDLARNFDGRSGTSFRAFVETLEEQAERGQGGEAPIVEEGTEGVRLMTVHKAKGLEFPVVILCDPTAPSETATAFRFTDATRKLSAHVICGCRPSELLENEELARRHDDAELVRLRSEAIRLLLPVSQLEDPVLLHSLKAALFLGFRKKFLGHPDHLAVTLANEPRSGAMRRFLVVYDAVPGGTGYLADLWKRDGILDVLENARDAMQTLVPRFRDSLPQLGHRATDCGVLRWAPLPRLPGQGR